MRERAITSAFTRLSGQECFCRGLRWRNSFRFASTVNSPRQAPSHDSCIAHESLLKHLQSTITRASPIFPRFTIASAFKEYYPNHHVVRTPRTTGLLRLAQSHPEEASAILDSNVPSTGARSWKSTPARNAGKYRRSSKLDHCKDGALEDEIELGRFKYTWNDHEFWLYTVEYSASDYETIQDTYILHQCDTSAPHCPIIDALLTRAAEAKQSIGEEILVFDEGYWEKDQALWNNVTKSSWSDIIVDKDLEKNLRSDVEQFWNRKEIYQSLGVPWKRGIILHGLPGNGKTRVIATLMNMLANRQPAIPSLYVKSLGVVSHEKIRRLFTTAREHSPCLLIFEDLDTLVGESMRSFFLNEVDGLEDNNGILMLGSTNYLDKLDASITKRPSRFDRKYHFGLPTKDLRHRYCTYWREKLRITHSSVAATLPGNFSHVVADMTEGFSYAYLQETFVSALMSLIQNDHHSPRVTDTSDAATTIQLLADKTLWDTLQAQILMLRDEIKAGKKSVEDASKNAVVGGSEPRSDSGLKRAGFGL